MAGRLCLVSSLSFSQRESLLSFLREKLSAFPRDASLYTADDKDCLTLAERLAVEFQAKSVYLDYGWDRQHTQGVKPTSYLTRVRTEYVREFFGEETEDMFRERLASVFSESLHEPSKIVFCPPSVLNILANSYNLDQNLLILDCRLTDGELRCEQQVFYSDFEKFERGNGRNEGYLKRVEEAVRETVREVWRKGDGNEEELLRNVADIVRTAFQTVESHYEARISRLNSQICELEGQLAVSSSCILSDFHRLREEQNDTVSELQRILSLLQSKQQKIDDLGLRERLENCEKQQKEAEIALKNFSEEKSADTLDKSQKSDTINSFTSLKLPLKSSVSPSIRPANSKSGLINEPSKEIATPLVFKRGFPLSEKPKAAPVSVPEFLPQQLNTIRKGSSKPLIQQVTVETIKKPLGISKPHAFSEKDIEKRRKEIEEMLGERLSSEASVVLEAVLRMEDRGEVTTEDLIIRVMNWKG